MNGQDDAPAALPSLSSLLSWLGRQSALPAGLRQSARRKFGRRERGRLVVCPTRPGFQLECRIGDPLDNLVYFEGEFEPELRLFLERHAGPMTTLVDVGCNIGYVSCLLASRFADARLVSIDANPEMVRRCEANLRLNGWTPDALACAAGSVDETRTFHVPKNRPSYASFGTLSHACEAIEVPVRRLDSLLREKGYAAVDLLKIDVEGFEPEVLRGLGDLPVRNICFEYSPGNLRNCGFTPDDLWSLPLWERYRLSLLENGTGRPLPFRPGEPLPNATEIAWAEARD